MKKLILIITALLMMSGVCWGAGYHATGLTSTNNRSSFAAGYNWLAWEGIDFSEYGKPGKFRIILTDSAGKEAIGYSSVPGTGEILGDNIIPDSSFDDASKWEITAGWTVNDGGSGNAVATNAAQNYRVAALPWIVNGSFGALFKGTAEVTEITGGSLRVVVSHTNSASYTDSGTKTGYANVDTSIARIYGVNANDTLSATVESYICQQVLTPPATGIHILDGPTGASGWSKIDASFDYRSIVEIEINPAATLTGVSASGVTVN